jgi:hypothetical protein
MMQSKLDEAKQITLEKFASAILRRLGEHVRTRIVQPARPSEIIYADFKVLNSDPVVTGFQPFYDKYITPAIQSLVESLEGFRKIAILDTGDVPGRVSVVGDERMSIKLITAYDSDGGGGENAGVVMSILIGVIK